MEVQISPASSFNNNDKSTNLLRASMSQPYEPSSKRIKSDLTFHCIVCSDVYDDPNHLYEHMKKQHPELYERENGTSSNDEEIFNLDEDGVDYMNGIDSEHELSDEDYIDLSRLLEPICELRQDDEEDVVPTQNGHSNGVNQLHQENSIGNRMITEDQIRFQLQLQMQLQNHLMQLQLNNAPKSKTNDYLENAVHANINGRAFVLRKNKIDTSSIFLLLNKN